MLWELILRWRTDLLVSSYTLSPPLLLTRDTPGLTAPMLALPLKCIFFTVTWQPSVFTHLIWPIKNVVPSHFLWLYLHAFHKFLTLLLTWNLFHGIEHSCDVGAQGSISAPGIYISLWWGVPVILPYLFCVMTSVQCKVSKIRIILFRHLFWCQVKFTFPQVHSFWVHFRNWVSFAASCYDPTVHCPQPSPSSLLNFPVILVALILHSSSIVSAPI